MKTQFLVNVMVGTKMGKKHNLSEEYLNSLSEEEQTKEMQSWTPEEQVRYLCPEGVMPLEEFRRIGLQMINDMYEEK